MARRGRDMYMSHEPAEPVSGLDLPQERARDAGAAPIHGGQPGREGAPDQEGGPIAPGQLRRAQVVLPMQCWCSTSFQAHRAIVLTRVYRFWTVVDHVTDPV